MTRRATNHRFVCQQPDCGRSFPKAEHLMRHERRHSGAKPFSCHVCHRRFARNDSMLRHSKLHGNGPQPTKLNPNPADQENDFCPPQPTPQSNGPLHTNQSLLTLDVPFAGGMQVHEYPPSAEYPSQLGEESLTSAEILAGTDGRGVSDVQQNFSQLQFQNNSGGWDVGFDWAFSSEDLFNLLRADSSMPPLPIPLAQYSPETQTSMAHDSVAGTHAVRDNSSSSVDASRQAVRSMNKMIRDLPAGLVAEVESMDKSSSFFEDCLDLFFTHFSPVLPLLHKPTFVARDCGSTLLLNILALGSLFVGTKDAVSRGESLWSLAHAVVATSWQSLMSQRGPRDECDGVQLVLTAALGQTYAMLSRNSNFRTTSQIFHGLGFYWSRHCRMYDTTSFTENDLPSVEAEASEKVEVWRTWAASETRLRAILAHYILDAQIAHFSGNPTSVRHATNPLPLPASTVAFNATSPDDWITEMDKSNTYDFTFNDFISAIFRRDSLISTRPISSLGIQVVLECMQSLVLEAAQAGGDAIGTVTQKEITAALLHLYRWQICKSPQHAELSLRWHAVFLSLTMDVGSFCEQISSSFNMPGPSQPQSQILLFKPTMRAQPRHPGILEIQKWANDSIDARRALLHAFAIQDITQSLPYKDAHAIHIPSTIFLAATVHAAHMLRGVQFVTVPEIVDWDTVWTSENAGDSIPPPLLQHSSFPQSSSLPLPSAQSSSSLPRSCHVPESSERSKLETQAFLHGKFFPPNPRVLTRKIPCELHALRMQLKAMASPWGISQQMDKTMELWHEKLRQRTDVRTQGQGWREV